MITTKWTGKKGSKGQVVREVGKITRLAKQKTYERIWLQQELGGEGRQMHESSGHGYAITRRKSSKETGTQKLKLGKEERGKDEGAMGTRAEMFLSTWTHTSACWSWHLFLPERFSIAEQIAVKHGGKVCCILPVAGQLTQERVAFWCYCRVHY